MLSTWNSLIWTYLSIHVKTHDSLLPWSELSEPSFPFMSRHMTLFYLDLNLPFHPCQDTWLFYLDLNLPFHLCQDTWPSFTLIWTFLSIHVKTHDSLLPWSEPPFGAILLKTVSHLMHIKHIWMDTVGRTFITYFLFGALIDLNPQSNLTKCWVSMYSFQNYTHLTINVNEQLQSYHYLQ